MPSTQTPFSAVWRSYGFPRLFGRYYVTNSGAIHHCSNKERSCSELWTTISYVLERPLVHFVYPQRFQECVLVTEKHDWRKSWRLFIYFLFIYCGISGFRREVDEICALLGHYAASRGNFLPTFRDTISVLSSGVKNPPKKDFGFMTHEDGPYRLSRNVGKKLPLLAA